MNANLRAHKETQVFHQYIESTASRECCWNCAGARCERCITYSIPYSLCDVTRWAHSPSYFKLKFLGGGGEGYWNSCTTCSCMIRRWDHYRCRWLMTLAETCIMLIWNVLPQALFENFQPTSNWKQRKYSIWGRLNIIFHYFYWSISPISVGFLLYGQQQGFDYL